MPLYLPEKIHSLSMDTIENNLISGKSVHKTKGVDSDPDICFKLI